MMRPAWIHLRPALLGVVLATLLAAGCDQRNPAPRDPQARRDAGVLVVALQDDGKTLDPHKAADAASMHLIENLYSSLLRYGVAYGEIEPDLAERWNLGDDGRTLTLHLRPDAVFHSGRPVTAADVRFSIERIRDSQVRAAHFAAVATIETPDDRTVVLRLDEPFAPLLSYLAHPMNAIVDREVVEANAGRIDRVAAGCGPFTLVEWRREQHLVMRRHDRYHHAGLPRLERVVFLPMPDPTTRTTAIRTGEIDLLLDTTGRDALVLRDAAGLRTESVPGTFWEYVGLNTARPPLDDVRVRQAIAWAIDREAINRVVKLGAATILDGGLIPPGHWAHANLSIYPRRDVERARQLLADAGHAPGSLRLVCRVGSAFPYQVAAGQMVKQQLREIGIEVQLLAQESGVFFEALGGGDFDLTVVGWVGFVDPDEWTYELFHSAGKWNQQKYANARVDELLESGRRTLDRDERRRIYAEAQRIITEEAPMVFLYANHQSAALRDGVVGYTVHPTASTIFLRETGFGDGPAGSLTRTAAGSPAPTPGRHPRPAAPRSGGSALPTGSPSRGSRGRRADSPARRSAGRSAPSRPPPAARRTSAPRSTPRAGRTRRRRASRDPAGPGPASPPAGA
jgi:peptide/nickel transport system substrate-binding protein